MDTFDKNEEFKARYLSNKETLFSIYRQIVFSDMVSSEVVAIYEAIDSFNGTTKTIERQSDSPFLNVSSYMLAGMDDLVHNRQFSKITTLLNRTKEHLRVVKQCSSVRDFDYKKLSTKIVSMALNDVIKIVNNSTFFYSKSLCQVKVGNFFIFFSNPILPIVSTLFIFLSSLNKTYHFI